MISSVTPMLWNLTDGLSAWLLTYLIHSTLLLAAAALTTRWLRDELALAETIWRTALIGGVVTATLQVGMGFDPMAGAWPISGEAAVGAPSVAGATLESLATSHGSSGARIPAYFVPVDLEPSRANDAGTPDGTATSPTTQPLVALSRTTRVDAARRAFALAWLVTACGLGIALVGSYRRLQRRLRAGRRLTDGPERDALSRLMADCRSVQRAELFANRGITVPLARGLRRQEIHLPEASLAEISADRRELVLAHELAHLERRDPAWLLATRIVETALCAQPLNRVARRELQEIAEYRADDWAVRRTGRPLGLARCLTAAAERAIDPAAWTTAAALAADGTRLGRRVQRLLARDYPRPEVPRPAWLLPASVAVLVVVALAAPGVRISTAGPVSATVQEEAPRTAEDSPAPTEAAADPQPSEPAGAPRPPAIDPAEAPHAGHAPAAAPAPETRPTAATSAAPRPAPTPTGTPTPAHSPAPAPAPRPGIPRVAPVPSVAPIPPIPPSASARLAEMAAELAALEAGRMAELAAELGEIDHEELAEISELAAEIGRLAVPDPEALAEMSALAAQLAAEVDRDVTERMATLGRQLAAGAELSDAERARIEDEIHGLAESLRPSEAERARIEAEIEALAQRVRPDEAAIERLEREILERSRRIERELESRFERERQRIRDTEPETP